MQLLSLEEEKRRIANIKDAREAVKDCLLERRVFDYKPGIVSYFLGEYPLSFSCEPTEYDYETLKKYSELGITTIKVHEEWNDAIRIMGADKFSAHDENGFKKFIDLCHSFGLKILPYYSSGYFHCYDPDYKEEFFLRNRYCQGQYFKYATCSLESAEWREFIHRKMVSIMENYEVDGIYNDHPPDLMIQLNDKLISEGKPVIDPELMPYDPYTEDFLARIYHSVKSRNGVYVLHLMENYKPITNERVYDYLCVGEGVSTGKALMKSKNYMPYIINLLDMKSQDRLSREYAFGIAIPYLQFTCLNHGRPITRDKTTADVKWYGVDENSLNHFWHKAAEFAKKHPDGPYTHGEFSAIPDPDDLVDVYGEYLNLYLPMIKDDTIVHVEIHETTIVQGNKIPENIIASLFSNEKQYLTFTNVGESAWTFDLTDDWIDRKTGERGRQFAVPPKSILFLEKIQ